jgi:trehalose synthase
MSKQYETGASTSIRRTAEISEVVLRDTSLSLMVTIVGAERIQAVRIALRTTRKYLSGRTVWHISDQTRGGVAELLRSTLPYLHGEDVTTRWATLNAQPEFRAFTKSLYYQLCGIAPADNVDRVSRPHILRKSVSGEC